MIHHLKSWWQRRRAKHYLKSHWHLIADIILLLVILSLTVNLIYIHYYPIPTVDTSKVEHFVKDSNSTSPGSLNLKTSIVKTTISSNQALAVKIHLENNGQTDISAIELSPKFLNDSFNVSKLESSEASSSLKISGRKLVLDNLAAGSVADFEVLFTISADTDSPRIINWLLNANYKQNEENHASSYSLPGLKLNTDLKIKAAAYYNSPLGDQLGSGPIPPIVGFPTNYWVFFEVDNRGNDITGLAVNAKLPAGVTLSNSKTLSAGDFTYNEGQRRLTWLVKNISVKNGRYQVGFELQLIPSAEQLGTNPLLVTNISYVATDAYTGDQLGGKLSPINTDLPLDNLNSGQGTVTK